MLHPEIPNLLYRWVDLQTREGMGFQIFDIFEVRNMVAVDMHISHHVDELSSFQTCNLSDQTCQKRIAGDIEGYAQSHVATSLVEDAVQFS